MSTEYSYEITKNEDNSITLKAYSKQDYLEDVNEYRISWNNHPLKLNMTISERRGFRLEPKGEKLPLRIRIEDLVKWVLKHIYIDSEHVASVTSQLISCGLGVTGYRTSKINSIEVVDLDTNGLIDNIVVETTGIDISTVEHFAVYSNDGVFGLYSATEINPDTINATRYALNTLNTWCLEAKIFDIINYPRKGIVGPINPLKLFKYYLKLKDLGVKSGLHWQGDKLTLWYDLGATRWDYDGMGITMLANDDVECRSLTDHEIQLYLDAINNGK